MGKNRYNVGGDIIQLRDGKYYMYYCMCKGDSPLSALGVARADKVEGPYKNLGILLRSGAGKGEDGTNYNATIHPNAVDPTPSSIKTVICGWFMVLIRVEFIF